MTKKTVWFNKNLSGIYHILGHLKASDAASRFRTLCTHTLPSFIGFCSADCAEVEPLHIDDEGYLRYCLDVCARHEVAFFFPGRRAAFLAERRESFDRVGGRLFTAGDAATLRLLDRKDRLYAALQAGELAALVPPHRVVENAEGFDAAVASLREQFDRLCVKPLSGMFGQGFRVLIDDDEGLNRLLGGDGSKMGLAYFRHLLAEAGNFRPLLVMPFLDGVERSVDALAVKGDLLRCVVRRKAHDDGAFQLIEEHPEAVAATAALTRALWLDALFNVQFREHEGKVYLLEINGRMSGGLVFSNLTGLDMPYWALRLAAGDCTREEIPMPRTGFYIAQSVQGEVKNRPAATAAFSGGHG